MLQVFTVSYLIASDFCIVLLNKPMKINALSFLKYFFPIADINPFIELPAYFLKMGYFFKPELFMKSDTARIGKRNAAD